MKNVREGPLQRREGMRLVVELKRGPTRRSS